MLTRKYRPLVFSEIIGQPAVDVVKSYIGNEDLPGLWIFHGIHGVGKTSTARIFSMALNCQNLDREKNPCCECVNCRDILNGVSDMLVEMDGASYRGIDDVRNLKRNVSLRTRGIRLVVIDEAHMLTDPAWNALLKITEEPPKSVVFVLVTTKIERIIETIRDRAIVVSFTRVKENALMKHLVSLARLEEVESQLSSEIIEKIISESDGSVRSLVKGLDVFASLAREGKEAEFISRYKSGSINPYEVELVKSYLGRRIGAFQKKVVEMKNDGYSPVDVLTSLYSGLLTVGLRGKGLTKFEGSNDFAGLEFSAERLQWFSDKFPSWFSLLERYPDHQLLTKLLLEYVVIF